jgi:toxin ParE1/3/4
VKVSYRQAASDDVVRQYRYYLVTLNLPEVAARFRDAVRRTVQSLRQHPLVGPHYRSSNPQLQNLRTWPVTGFEATRIYYFLDEDTIRLIRVLHGKRDVKRILEREGAV